MNQFTQLRDAEFSISILTIFEFDYRLAGCEIDLAPVLREIKQDMLRTYRTLSLSLAISEKFGKLKAAFKVFTGSKPKTMKGHTVDMILAATALEHDAAIVSSDRIFPLIQATEPRLKVENWAA